MISRFYKSIQRIFQKAFWKEFISKNAYIMGKWQWNIIFLSGHDFMVSSG